jgi:hypothetical protein
MSEDSMKRLARANPVNDRLPVAPFVAPAGEDGDERPALLVRRPRSHARRNGALALAGLAGGAAVSVLLASGSSNSPVDVLAAVYAATAPRGGIVESVTVIRNDFGPGHQSTERLREWLQAPASRRRGLATFTKPGSAATQLVDVVYSPQLWQFWSVGPLLNPVPFRSNEPDTIRRIRWSPAAPADNGRMGFSGGLAGEQWTQLFHTLYLKHQLRVAGQVRHRGRLLWKLEETPARARRRAREDQTRYYVLVDPHTFLPVYTRLIDLARPGQPTISEDELLSLRTLPATAGNEKLFDLTLQHPSARVVTQTLAPVPPRRPAGPPRR